MIRDQSDCDGVSSEAAVAQPFDSFREEIEWRDRAALCPQSHDGAAPWHRGRFFALARSLGISEVEIRNDLAGNAILDGTPAERGQGAGRDAGLTIVSINALQRFNEWTAEREREAIELTDYAAGVRRKGAGAGAGQ